MEEYGRIWQNMVEYGRLWQNMVEYGRTWQNINRIWMMKYYKGFHRF